MLYAATGCKDNFSHLYLKIWENSAKAYEKLEFMVVEHLKNTECTESKQVII